MAELKIIGMDEIEAKEVSWLYNFVGYIEISENPDNYVADTRQGVAVEYLTA